MESGFGGYAPSAPDNVGRIPKATVKGTVIFLYVLALLAVAMRTFIRTRYQKLQLLDDGFLLFAVVLMTTAFGILFGFLDDMYIAEAFIYDTLAVSQYLGDIVAIGERVQIFTIPYIILSISGIFAVKFSFLFFFKNILSRIRPLTIYWKGVAIFTAFSWAFSVGFSAYGCPYTDERALSCAQGGELWKALDTSIILIVFDISTDLLILSIPVIVIKQIKLPRKKKVYLAASLCVSAVMVVVAILQAATLTYEGLPDIDVVWEIYFQFVELCIAIIVVSSTAFRAFFVQRGSQQDSNASPRMPSWYRYKTYKKVWHKIFQSTSTEESDAPRLEPDIPRATMTGMRTFIDRGAGSPWSDSGSDRGQEMSEVRRPPRAARQEPVGHAMASLISPDEEYHRIQRGLQHPPFHPDVAGNLEADDEPSPEGVTPISSSESGLGSSEIGEPSAMSAAARRRSSIGISRSHLNPKLIVPSNSPMPDPVVSPIEWQGYPAPSSGMPSRPSEQISRRDSRAATAPLDHSLPPTPPGNSGPHMATFLDEPGPSKSDEESQIPSETAAEPEPQPPRRPSQSSIRRALRPGLEQEPMRDSGLKRAIQSSFDMASDIRPQNSESWFYDN